MQRAVGFAWSAAFVAVATGVAYALAPAVLATEDVVMLYLAVVMIAAVRFGRAASVVAAGLSVIGFDFFFVPPRYTLFVASPRHLLTFGMMFAVGLLLSTLARRLKSREEEAALRKRSEDIKTSLLSAVSHDLRTPLAAITGAATTLRNDGALIPEPEKLALLETIADEAFSLERLVANLLDMTRVESGALKLAREWIPLEELVGTALARVEGRLGERVVKTQLAADVPLVHVDGALFEQALVNLLDNAAKHTPASATVVISARKTPAGVVIDVADDGPGLPAGIDVFQRFVRGPAAHTGGVGLGLAIVKGIVEAHGGTVVAVPRDDDDAGAGDTRGARFRILLPEAEVPPTVPQELG